MNLVTLPHEHIERCHGFGERCALAYVNKEKEASRYYATRGIERDPTRLAVAKMAECGLAVWLGLPVEAIDWSAFVDGGTDLIWQGVSIDVKQTSLTDRHRRLIWSPTKGLAVLQRHRFEIFVLVKVQAPVCEIAGWISRVEFIKRHTVAGDADPIDNDSLFVLQERLWPWQDFKHGNALAQMAIRMRRQFDFIFGRWP